MNSEEFAAQRRAVFVTADEDIEPLVKRALRDYARGQSNWYADLVEGAQVLWLEIFLAESPNADPDRFIGRFTDMLTESLQKTAKPDDLVEQTQVDRVTKWLGTVTVNDATYIAAGARGVRFKRWVTMHDHSVRGTHMATDGQMVRIGATFDVGGYGLRYPGEPVGPPEIWINCRCVIQAAARGGEVASMSPTTFAIAESEPDTDAEPIDIPVDETEEDEDEITEIPVHGVLAPEGVPTGDGRQFGADSLTNRELPLPIAYQLMSADGHSGSVTVGRIDEVFRQGNEMRFRGALVLTKEHTPAVIEGIIDGTVRGISVDVDDVEVDMSTEYSEEDDGKMPVTTFSHARIAGVTIVPIPAFQEAFISLGHEFADELDAEALAACAACADPEDENEDIITGYDAYRDVPTAERKKRAADGTALPDGSFPIANEEDLRNAIQAIGRAKDPAAAKAHIKKRARALGKSDLIPDGWALIIDLTELPDEDLEEYNSLTPEEQDEWAEQKDLILASAFAPGTKDGPGWITHPIPTSRIRRYWTHGKGAAKIRWGAPGDFNRCRRQLAKYIANPDWLAGACANMHKEAIGIWPSTHAGKRGHSLLAAGEPAPMFTLVASASYEFDSNMFARMELEDPRVGVVVDGDHVYGYMAQWGVCHIGISGICTEAPNSQTDYWYYATGIIDTTEGPIHVGQITMDTGHAPLRSNAKIAAAHYDNTGAAVADVAVGEDAFGIWFSGVIRPSATDAQRHALKASGRISGDWRNIGGNLELVAGLVVNVPGLPIPHALAASANGVQTALIAAGIVEPEKPETLTASVTIDADTVAGIVRASVAEYRHAEKRAEKVGPLRETLRQKRIESLRSKIKE